MSDFICINFNLLSKDALQVSNWIHLIFWSVYVQLSNSHQIQNSLAKKGRISFRRDLDKYFFGMLYVNDMLVQRPTIELLIYCLFPKAITAWFIYPHWWSFAYLCKVTIYLLFITIYSMTFGSSVAANIKIMSYYKRILLFHEGNVQITKTSLAK